MHINREYYAYEDEISIKIIYFGEVWKTFIDIYVSSDEILVRFASQFKIQLRLICHDN